MAVMGCGVEPRAPVLSPLPIPPPTHFTNVTDVKIFSKVIWTKSKRAATFFFAKPSLNSPIERTDKYSFVSGLPKPYEYLWPSNFWHRYWSTGWKWVGTRLRDLIEALGGVRPHRQEKVGGLFGMKIILGYRNICFTDVPYASRFHSHLSV